MRVTRDTVLCLMENSIWSYLILLFPLIKHDISLQYSATLSPGEALRPDAQAGWGVTGPGTRTLKKHILSWESFELKFLAHGHVFILTQNH